MRLPCFIFCGLLLQLGSVSAAAHSGSLTAVSAELRTAAGFVAATTNSATAAASPSLLEIQAVAAALARAPGFTCIWFPLYTRRKSRYIACPLFLFVVLLKSLYMSTVGHFVPLSFLFYV